MQYVKRFGFDSRKTVPNLFRKPDGFFNIPARAFIYIDLHDCMLFCKCYQIVLSLCQNESYVNNNTD